MAFVKFLRSTPGRVLRVFVGFVLIAYGATQVTLVGLILMMVGVIPTVTGLASLCLPDEVARTREAAEAMRGRTRERRA